MLKRNSTVHACTHTHLNEDGRENMNYSSRQSLRISEKGGRERLCLITSSRLIKTAVSVGGGLIPFLHNQRENSLNFEPMRRCCWEHFLTSCGTHTHASLKTSLSQTYKYFLSNCVSLTDVESKKNFRIISYQQSLSKILTHTH